MIFASAYLHIPDGFLSFPVSIISWVLTAVFVFLAIRKASQLHHEEAVSLIGLLAAFIFAAQMVNVPIVGGTSGHLIGATLSTVILGPWISILIMTSVIALQALLFQDGGLVVMGSNILIMGVIPALVTSVIYPPLSKPLSELGQKLALIGIGFASWLSVMMAAMFTSFLLAASNTTSLKLVLPAMMGIHALIGIGEAIITVTVVIYLQRVLPDVMEIEKGAGWGWVVSGAATVVLTLLLTPLASESPDGLESVAKQLGFDDAAIISQHASPLSGYLVFGIDSALSVIAAGTAGVILTVFIVAILSRFLYKRQRKQLQ